ncbi:MAG: DUF2993 domain-containing protein [Planktothrix sp. GU0601_MAG3]|nr:MAG: DUF2993 domain-containing protein [Planktothrix sp. GU0601_MAG3]
MAIASSARWLGLRSQLCSSVLRKLKPTFGRKPVAKLLQGSVDGFDFIGNGMLMYNGLRIAVMELYVQAVSIDFSAIFTGQVKLRQPTQANLRVVLTEEDLTDSFNTPFVVEKLQRLKYLGESITFTKTMMTVTPEKNLRIQSGIILGNSEEPVQVDFTTQVEVQDRRKIQFIDVQYSGNQEEIDLSQALVNHVNDLLDLDKFALDGTQLKVDRLRIQNNSLIFYGSAQINQFPKGKKN